MRNSISNRRRILEIIAVAFTALGKFVFMDYLNLRLPYVASAVLCWTIYIIYRSRRQKGILSYWGFRKDNFGKTIKLLLPFAVGAVLLFVIVGYFQNSLNPTWHMLPILITYPLWGIIQQFLIIGLVLGNMHDMEKPRWNKFLMVILSAVLFSVVHYPSNWLMIGTFLLAIFYGFVYLRIRNLYALGLFHGWLGALFYYTVVGTDPFQDAFLVWLQ